MSCLGTYQIVTSDVIGSLDLMDPQVANRTRRTHHEQNTHAAHSTTAAHAAHILHCALG